MTILGGLITPDRAVLWSDSEIFSPNGPAGEASKMGLSSFGFAIVGSGSMSLVKQAARTAHDATSFDRLPKRLANDLRQLGAKIAPRLILENPRWCAFQTIYAAGYSQAANRVVGWELNGAGLFEPRLVGHFATPFDLPITDLLGVASLGDILCVARRQIALVRASGQPRATGRALVIAEITESSLFVRRIPDFDADAPPAAQPPRAVESLSEVVDADLAAGLVEDCADTSGNAP